MNNPYLSQLPILPDEKIILPTQVQKNLKESVEKIIEQTDTKEYRKWMQNFFVSNTSPLPEEITDITKKFVLPPCEGGIRGVNSSFQKNFASFDFHLDGENNDIPKCIEFSFFPVGDSFIRGVIPSEFSDHYQKNFLELFKGKKKIAIVDTQISKQKRMAEFLWTKEILENEGFEVFLADAESITVVATRCDRPHTERKIFVNPSPSSRNPEDSGCAGSHPFVEVNYILNRCTFSDYLKNPEKFSGLVEVEKQFPEKISTTYREWLFSEKISAAYFTEKNILPEYFPKTIFSSPSLTSKKISTICGENFIAKPLFSYASNGIFINPNSEKISEIKQKNIPYLYQETIPAPTLPDKRKYEIRVFMIHGKISVFAARVYNGDLSNYDDTKSGICAVEFE